MNTESQIQILGVSLILLSLVLLYCLFNKKENTHPNKSKKTSIETYIPFNINDKSMNELTQGIRGDSLYTGKCNNVTKTLRQPEKSDNNPIGGDIITQSNPVQGKKSNYSNTNNFNNVEMS